MEQFCFSHYIYTIFIMNISTFELGYNTMFPIVIRGALKAQWLSGLAFNMLNASKRSLGKPFHSPGLQDNYLPREGSRKSAFESKAHQCPFWGSFFGIIASSSFCITSLKVRERKVAKKTLSCIILYYKLASY